VEATFPELARWEERHGSLIRGARAARRPEVRDDGPLFASLPGGLVRLVEALAAAIATQGGRIRTAAPVGAIHPAGDGFRVEVDGGDPVMADAVVLGTHADESARLLGTANRSAAAELEAIRYVSTAVVALSYPAGTGDRIPAASGFIVPAVRGSPARPLITACTWVSRKWPHVAFGDRAVLRAFVGRDGQEAVLDRSDPELVAAVVQDIEAIAPIGAVPEAAAVRRWERGMPQYEVGHLDRVNRADAALAATPGLFITGSAYRGVGIADCVRDADRTAAGVRRHLAGWRGRAHDDAPSVPLERRSEASER
jgi:oxygen-dependent protoporphyrinogen oxidase